MCWSCYGPLSGEGGAREKALAAREAETLGKQDKNLRVRRWERIENVKCVARTGLFVCSLGAITLSGYFPDHRLVLVSVGAACAVAVIAWGRWDNHVAARQRSADGDENPLERIINTILLYAVRDGATQIRLRAGLGIRVDYLIKDEWQEQMRIPSYVWMPIREMLLQTTNQWQKAVPFRCEEKIFEFWPEFRHDHEYPCDELTLTLDKTKFPAPLPEP